MGDKRLLLEIPDPIWAGILRALRSDPNAVLDLEMVCKSLRGRLQAHLSILQAHLELSYQQLLWHQRTDLFELERLLELTPNLGTSRSRGIPALGHAANQSTNHSLRAELSHTLHRATMLQQFHVSAAEQAELDEVVRSYASQSAALQLRIAETSQQVILFSVIR